MNRDEMIQRLASVKEELDKLANIFPASGQIDLTQTTLHDVYQALVRIAFQNETGREALIHDA